MAGQEGQIHRLTHELCQLTQEDWIRYIFADDPLSGRLTLVQKLDYGAKAAECGREMAEELTRKHGDRSVEELIAACGGQIDRPAAPAGGLLPVFASFTEPDSIMVYSENAQATDELRTREGLEELMGDAHTEDVLLAHELFHMLEYRDPELYTRQKHLRLWKLGRWENRSGIFCLSEIAAMTFAEALTGLTCSVYVLDMLMLYVNNPQLALQKQRAILDFVGR